MPGSLGSAYVQIIPSAKGISGGIAKAIAPEASVAGKMAGGTISQNIGSGLSKIGGAMTSYITKPAMAAAGVLGGATLFSGWKRMTEIDSAKVKLEAIGNSAKDVTSITNNAMESVKGTAYGMNEAMTTAASSVAAGVKPGKELTEYLTAVGDAAAVAGTDMSSMGSIFNKVATSGKAHNDVLGQMAEAGIPIYQYLADTMKVPAEEVFELAKDGEIGLSQFQEAVSTHIGGAAKEMGSKTITGAIENVKASISRIGANFLGSSDDADSFAGKILPMLNKLMDNLEPLEEKAKELGSKFADAFGKVVDVISKIPLPVLGGLGGALVGIGPVLGIVGKGITTIGPFLSVLPASITAILGPVTAIGAVLALAFAKSEAFRNALGGLVSSIISAVMPAVQMIVPFIKMLIGEIMNVAKAIGDALAPVIKLLTPVITFLIKIVITQMKIVLPIVKTVIKTISAAIQAAAAIIQGVATGLNKILGSAWSAIKSAAGKAWKAIKGVIVNPMKAVQGVVRGIVNKIKSFLNFTGLGAKVKGVFNAIKGFITKPIDKAKSVISKIIGAIKKLFSFKISFPKIPMPHFSVKPAGWKVGDLLKGKIPKLGIKWYAEGGIMKRPMIFGGGENGPEGIVPLDPFWDKMDKISEDLKGSKEPQIINYITVNGAEDPEAWADKFSKRLVLDMRTR